MKTNNFLNTRYAKIVIVIVVVVVILYWLPEMIRLRIKVDTWVLQQVGGIFR